MRALLHAPLAIAAVAAALAPHASGQQQPGRERAFERAMAWLEQTIDPETWLDETSGNARGKRIVARSLLAWLRTSRSSPEQDERSRQFDAAQRRVATAKSVEDLSFATWFLGSAAFYLAEHSLEHGSPHPSWPALVKRLGSLRNSEDGWAHGNMEGLVPGYPSTVMAATNWALASLGYGRALGADVPAEWIEAGVELLAATQSGAGALPYGGRPYRIGMEAGRTAGSVVALAAVGASKSDMFGRAAEFVYRNMARVPEGHASPAMHVMNGALAAYTLGEQAWRRYEQEVVSQLLQAQRDNGTFEDLLGERSPDSMNMMGDAVSNDAYVTALYAAALRVPETRLANWLRRRVSFTPASAPVAGSTPEPSWRWPSTGIAALATNEQELIAIQEDGDIVTLAVADGRERSRASTDLQLERPLRVRCRTGELFAWTPGGGPMFAFDLQSQELRWQTKVTMAPFSGARLTSEDVFFVQASGTAEALRLRDGIASRSMSVPSGLKRQIVPLADGSVIATADHRIQCIEASGEVRWRGRNRHPEADVAGSWTSVAAGADRCVIGSTDGTVTCRMLDDAELVWRTTLDAGVTQLVRTPDDGPLIAMTSAGTVTALVDERVRWSTDVSSARQDPEDHRSRIVSCTDDIWVKATGSERLLRLSPATGEILATVPCPADAAVAVSGTRAFVANADGVTAYGCR